MPTVVEAQASTAGTGGGLVVKTIDEALAAHAQARVDRLVAERGPPSVPPRVIVPSLVGALLALLTWWLDHDMPYPPERMDETFRQLTAPAVSAIFGNMP